MLALNPAGLGFAIVGVLASTRIMSRREAVLTKLSFADKLQLLLASFALKGRALW